MNARLLRVLALVIAALPSCAGSSYDLPRDSRSPKAKEARPYFTAALGAARWLQANAIATPNGKAWPADPLDPTSVSSSLYLGTSGVVLFLFAAHAASGDPSLLRDARAGADTLLSSYATEKGSGFYDGMAGMCFVLMEAAKVTRDERYDRGARDCVRQLRERARRAGSGVTWDEATDIVSGSAGIGLFLLYASREHREPADKEVALAAANHLIDVAIPVSLEGDAGAARGLKWYSDPEHGKLMPNFSHGTAGVAYFLAETYAQTKRPELLDAARAGTRYLISVAEMSNGGCLIFHSEPAQEPPTIPFYRHIYYLGWCHGPAGTSRLFQRMYEVTGDASYRELVERGAKSILDSGIPEQSAPGFWNNVGLCCGAVSVADYFLKLAKQTGRADYDAFARKMASYVIARATPEGDGLKWIHAENRIEPEHAVAQTGLMQGAAGIGLVLLRIDALDTHRTPPLSLPDDPFVL